MFAQIDIFGKPVSFNFNGKDKSRSSIGAWFTLAFIGFVCWSIFQLGQDLIDRKDPKTITSEFFQENPERMVISPETFNFAFGLQDPVTAAHYINESIYTIEVTNEQTRRVVKEDGSLEFQSNKIVLKTETCTKEHFGSLAPKFENIELNALYCLQRNQSELEEIQIQGVFESPVFEIVMVVIKQCNNLTSKVPCAPKEILDTKLSGFFATYFTNVAIEPRNYIRPNFRYRDSFYTAISNTYSKEITLWLSHVEVSSDYGWLTKQVRNENYIRLERPQEYINMKPAPNHLMNFIIRVAKMGTHYERSYIKVPDIIAQANGFASTGLIIGFIILMPYSNIKFYERLINELFDVKILRKNRKGKTNGRRMTTKRSASRIIVDGDNRENLPNQEDQFNLEINFFEKQNSNFDSPKSSSMGVKSLAKPTAISSPKNTTSLGQSDVNLISHYPRVKTDSFAKANLVKQRNPDRAHSAINFTALSPKNRKYRNYSFSNISKDVKFLKFDLKLDQNDTKHKRNKQKRLSNSKAENAFLSYQLFDSRLLKEKPNQTGQLQIKIEETFEVEAPGDIDFAIESVTIDKQQRNNANSKERFEIPNYENASSSKMPAKTCMKEPKYNQTRIKTTKFEEDSEQEVDEKEILQRAELLPSQLTKDSDHLNITFGEYLRSYLCRSKDIKDKFDLLNEGIRRIEERLNIFNLLKKLREVDKLKLLLLENDQLVLFDTLPNPELSHTSNTKNKSRRKSFSHNQLKETKFVAEKRKHDLVKYSYVDLKKKPKPTMIDEKLLEIYDDIIDS